MKYLITFGLFALLFCSSCGKNDLPDYNRLGGMRVLAMKANLPEASVGSSVTVTPVVSDLEGQGRTISYTALGCTDPGVSYGANPDCASATDRATLGSGTFTMSAPLFTATAAAVTFTIPASVLSKQSPLALVNGVAYTIVYTFSFSGQTLNAFKRIIVSTNPTKNQNPLVTDIRVGSTSLTSLPSSHVTVLPNIPTTSLENYSVLTSTGTLETKQETLTTTWFISEGSFDSERTSGFDQNGYSPGNRSSSHSVVMVVVSRDSRGGEDFLIRGL